MKEQWTIFYNVYVQKKMVFKTFSTCQVLALTSSQLALLQTLDWKHDFLTIKYPSSVETTSY